MPVTPLPLVKQHLNLDHDADDPLLSHYTEASETWVAAYTGTPFASEPLRTQAVLMLVAHQYETREAVSFAHPYASPYGVHDMLSGLKERVTGYVPDPAE